MKSVVGRPLAFILTDSKCLWAIRHSTFMNSIMIHWSLSWLRCRELLHPNSNLNVPNILVIYNGFQYLMLILNVVAYIKVQWHIHSWYSTFLRWQCTSTVPIICNFPKIKHYSSVPVPRISVIMHINKIYFSCIFSKL